MSRRHSLPILSLVAGLLAGGCSAVTRGSETTASLPAATPQTAPADASRSLDQVPPYVDIAEGEIHRHAFDLAGPAFLLFEVEQRGIDLRLGLIAPDGREVAAADGGKGRWSWEWLPALTPVGGRFVLEIRSAAGETGGGRYTLAVLERRDRQPDDEERLALERRIAAALREEAAPQEARVVLTAELERLRDLGEPRREAEVLHRLAKIEVEAGDPEAALRHLQRQLELRQSLQDREGEIVALGETAFVLSELGRPEDAISVARRSLEQASEMDDPDLRGGAANTLAFLYLLQGKPAEALKAAGNAARLLLEAGNFRDAAITLANKGMALRLLGREQEGCLAILEAANTASKIRSASPSLYLKLGLCHKGSGRISAAMAALQEALRLADDAGDERTRGQVLVHIGSLLAELGEHERAEIALEEALPLLSSDDFRIAAEVHLGWLASARGDAESCVERIRRLKERYGDDLSTTNRISTNKVLGAALVELERYEEALVPLERAADLQAENRFGDADTWRQIGRTRRSMGDFEGARKALEMSLEASEGPLQQGAAYQEMARLEAEAGDVQQGLEHVEKAIELREAVRADVVPVHLRASYLARWRDDFSLWIALLLRTAESGAPGARERAFAASERAHARTLQELLLESGGHRTEAAPALLDRQRELTARINDLVHRYTISESGTLEEAELLGEIRNAEAELEALEWRIRRPVLEPATAVEAQTLADVQDLLGARDALLEYALGEERSFLFAVRRHSLDVHVLPPAGEIAERVERIRMGLYPLDPTLWRRLIADSHELYHLLLAPAEADLATAERLIIVPDRDLFYLPFEVLLREVPAVLGDPAELAPHYVVSRWDVGYAPSAMVIGQLRHQSRPSTPKTGDAMTLLAFADSRGEAGTAVAAHEKLGARGDSWGPLPGSREEVRAIAALLPEGRARVFEGAAASLDHLLDASSDTVRWFHFAVHGHLDPARPNQSALILAGRNLYAREIYGLRLDAELVVLSACQTGLGKEVWGEELIGLSRAFFYAGVPTVVMSLWNVADASTASLMVEMYTALLEGATPSEALSRAKRSFVATGSSWQHPYYWAPFIVFGEPGGNSDRNATTGDDAQDR